MPLTDRTVHLSNTLQLKQCFVDSFRIWTANIRVFFIAAVLAVVLGTVSFTILNGALYGGLLVMMLKAMSGHKPYTKDVFGQLRRFIPLFAAFWFTILLTVAGMVLLVVPGVFLGTSCFYLLILAVDRRMSFDEAFVQSRKAVKRYGFWKHFLLALIVVGILIAGTLLSNRIELFGFQVILLLIMVSLLPLALGLLASAYRQTLMLEEENRRRYEQEYEYMRDELETAHDMQMGLLPKENPKIYGYNIAGICIPANHVGGDYFAYRWLDGENRRLAVIMADVSGKAMIAAVIAVRFNEMLRYELQNHRSPSEILSGLQNSLRGQIEEDTFITSCAAILDTVDGTIEIANAGYCHPFHYSTRSGKVSPVRINGFALGMPSQFLSDTPYDTTRFSMESGDVVMFYSDGVTDAENNAGDFYGEQRIRSLFHDSAGIDTAEQLVGKTVDSIATFSHSVSQTDDISVVILKREIPT